MFGNFQKFRFWCQKVLPLVYDDSISYYETLCKVVAVLNKLIEGINELPEYIQEIIDEKFTPEVIVDLISDFLTGLEDAITSNNEGKNETSDHDYTAGQMLWLNYKLYKVVRDIEQGDRFVIGGTNPNLVLKSFEEEFNEFTLNIKKVICVNDEDVHVNATQTWSAGDWIWWGDELYKASREIVEGTTFIFTGENTNMIKVNVVDIIGNVNTLTTDNKNDIVSAINSLVDNIGGLDNLDTEDKSNIVSAINEINTLVIKANNDIGDIDELETEAKDNVVNAINELLSDFEELDKRGYYNVKDYGAKGDGVTDDTEAIQNAINAAVTSSYKLPIVYFPRGNYIVTDTISVSEHHGCVLLGASTYDTYITHTGDYGDTFYFFRCRDIHIENLSIQALTGYVDFSGDYSDVTIYDGSHILFDQCFNCGAKNNYIYHLKCGIDIRGGARIAIENNLIMGGWSTDSSDYYDMRYGIHVGMSDTTVSGTLRNEDSIISNNRILAEYSAQSTRTVGGTTYTGVIWNGPAVGIMLNGTEGCCVIGGSYIGYYSCAVAGDTVNVAVDSAYFDGGISGCLAVGWYDSIMGIGSSADDRKSNAVTFTNCAFNGQSSSFNNIIIGDGAMGVGFDNCYFGNSNSSCAFINGGNSRFSNCDFNNWNSRDGFSSGETPQNACAIRTDGVTLKSSVNGCIFGGGWNGGSAPVNNIAAVSTEYGGTIITCENNILRDASLIGIKVINLDSRWANANKAIWRGGNYPSTGSTMISNFMLTTETTYYNPYGMDCIVYINCGATDIDEIRVDGFPNIMPVPSGTTIMSVFVPANSSIWVKSSSVGIGSTWYAVS